MRIRRNFGAKLNTLVTSMACDSLIVSPFTTLQSSSRERHDAWVAQGWPSVTRLCDFIPEGDFRASSNTISLESLRVTCGGFGAQKVHRSSNLIRTAPADNLFVTIPLDISINTQNGVAGPGSVAVIDLTQEWRHHAPQGSMVTIPIPRSIALEQRIDPSSVHGVILDPAAATLVREQVLSIVNDAVRIPQADAGKWAETIVQLLAVGLAQNFGLARPKAAARNIAVRHRAERLVLSSLIDGGLSVTSLAERLGVSRSHLYRIFADGDGIEKAILRERLHAATRDIADTNELISEIAERYNFKEYSHFSRVFLDEIGMRPNEWRDQARTRC